MSQEDFIRERTAQRGSNLLLQELRESCERARLGGFIYPVAALMTFLATDDGRWSWHAAALVGGLLLLALVRCLVGMSRTRRMEVARRRLRLLWTVVLGTTLAWGAFGAWAFVTLPEAAALVVLLARAVAAAGSGQPVSLLIVDVDHFKKVNDSLGHRAGDACLVELAARLRGHFDAPGDLPARLGGEEFAGVVAAPRAQAARRAECFRQALAAQPVQALEQAVALTVSIGCGQFDPRRHGDADEFYGDVDAALYRAKQAGRDRIEHAGPALATA